MTTTMKKLAIILALVVLACAMSALVAGCNVNVNINPTTQPGTTGSQQPSDPTSATSDGIVTTVPSEDENDTGAIEIIIPNEDDGEEGEDEYGPMANGSESDPVTGNTGNGDSGESTGALTPDGNEGNTSDSNQENQENQGNTGSGTAGSGDGDPDLIIDFDDIFGS